MWGVIKGEQDCARRSCWIWDTLHPGARGRAWSIVGMRSLFFLSRQGMGAPRETESWE